MYTQARTSIRAQLMRLSLIIVAVSIALSLSGTMYLALRGEQEALDSNLLNSASILCRPCRGSCRQTSWPTIWTPPRSRPRTST